MEIKCKINGKQFELELEDNGAVSSFLSLLPLTVTMEELNGNEKYVYLDKSLPTSSKNPGTIHEGDFMLFGSSCLVLFYESFQTSYSYTRLGKVKDLDGYKPALGRGDVEVTFERLF